MVALTYPVDPDQEVAVPPAVVAALREVGQPTAHGMYKSGAGPWRLHYQLTGPDRPEAGHSVAARLTESGYETEVVVTP